MPIRVNAVQFSYKNQYRTLLNFILSYCSFMSTLGFTSGLNLMSWQPLPLDFNLLISDCNLPTSEYFIFWLLFYQYDLKHFLTRQRYYYLQILHIYITMKLWSPKRDLSPTLFLLKWLAAAANIWFAQLTRYQLSWILKVGQAPLHRWRWCCKTVYSYIN